MEILVLYTLRQKKFRKTITEHLYSFRHYSNHNFTYVNVGPDGIPSYLKELSFDAVILHYTFLASERFLKGDGWDIKIKGLADIKGFKIAIPQDEYSHTGRLVKLFKEISIDVICTCFYSEKDIEFAYAQYLSPHVIYLPVFTGYVDENLVKNISKRTKPCRERKIDIGYRASMLPAHLGKHGQLKYEIIGEFNNRLKYSNLVLDIKRSNLTLINEDKKAVKHGDEWNAFLLNCKAFIGCEGGSSLLDFDGHIQDQVYDYSEKYPKADFNEIEKSCFPGMDHNISCFAISPRHFEAATTKTLQILVEGYYGGAFKPGIHYLSLKKDYSNFNEIIETLLDNERCQRIVDDAYKDIVLSGIYSYKSFVNNVLNTIKKPIINVAANRTIKFRLLILVLQIREHFVRAQFSSAFSIYRKAIDLRYGLYLKFVKPYLKK